MGVILERRRRDSERRLDQLRGCLHSVDELCGRSATVYVTGSFGREEAGSHSDLDLFIAGGHKGAKRALTGLDEIRVKAQLIDATRSLGMPDFSGDGEYLQHYTGSELVGTLGKREDDASNTFTARLLLLLESRPLVGQAFYSEILNDVIRAYWRDYNDHRKEFVPAFLANDILRLWRTFCVNYEARTSTEPERKRAKRRLKNYKLKHSRLLTCYSALLYLLAVFTKTGTVRPADAFDMARLTPTQRLEWLLYHPAFRRSKANIRNLLRAYEQFLSETDAPEGELIDRFLDRKRVAGYQKSANKLGDSIFRALAGIGRTNTFYRLLVV